MPRRSRHRDAVLDVLRRSHDHPTADQIYDAVRQTLPRISLGTVYRNLEILASQGLIQKIVTGSGPMRFDGNPHRHVHLRCERCGALEDVPMKQPLNPTAFVDEGSGQVVRSFVLEFSGLCRRCASADVSGGASGGCMPARGTEPAPFEGID
ncbi:Fur family transcriptional regulator [Desulfosoma caldarium]|uniref:Fur family ferric uptake transcriptional regulator/Fur family peroxide stress response transcriptional regulator n=1 Tax=Desulfosoma caldarium TaxID=610254 RepID=A0A3N1UG09_9BACT|nr:transcriptional repressor [Desulfosoma caldarium]ROQ90245.1 Fur family ferric uptake transcriptional regulator/Fur family peroxide stress response transcriptional regulator [Desulfosoma caldarium]